MKNGSKTIMNSKVAENVLDLLISTATSLPNICMRIVMQIKNDYSRELKPSILNFLNRLVFKKSNDLRKNVNIWKGFCIFMKDLKPDSFAIILKLPMDLLTKFLKGDLNKDGKVNLAVSGNPFQRFAAFFKRLFEHPVQLP